MADEQHTDQPTSIFTQRLDFYYQTIAIYAIVLLSYSVLRGSIEGSSITIRLIDPISILLVIFIIGTALAMLFEFAKKRAIVVGEDFIIFKSGKNQKVFVLSDIERISIGRDKSFHFRSNYRTCLMKVKNRKRAVRIRFSSYHNDAELAQAMINLRKKIK